MAGKPLTKSQFQSALAEKTGLSKKEVVGVLDAMCDLVKANLKEPGIININGLMKIEKKHKPAVPERQGTNPFTGEPTTFKAKAARDVVKVRPLKTLKDMV